MKTATQHNGNNGNGNDFDIDIAIKPRKPKIKAFVQKAIDNDEVVTLELSNISNDPKPGGTKEELEALKAEANKNRLALLNKRAILEKYEEPKAKKKRTPKRKFPKLTPWK